MAKIRVDNQMTNFNIGPYGDIILFIVGFFNVSSVQLFKLLFFSTIMHIYISEIQEKENYHLHIDSITSGPSLAVVVSQRNAVRKLCDLIGPEEPMAARQQSQFLWRGEFGTDLINNGLYCEYISIISFIDIYYANLYVRVQQF